jgi:exosortase H (IPTLxxWG-CTERM-specific)
MAGMTLLLTEPFTRWLDLDGKISERLVFVFAKLLNGFGIPCRCEGKLLHLQGISLAVKFGCTGIEAVLIFAAGVLAFPGSWKRKGVGLLAGGTLLECFNWLRILLLVYTGIHFPALFEMIHAYVGQGIMIITALILFFLYIRYATRPILPSVQSIHH